MKWSLKLGRVSGIKIQVHWTFVILIAWVVLLHVSQGAGVMQAARVVLLVLAVFACVVLHELGHALTAKRYGIVTRDITLLPIGGVARLERMPDDPVQELWVAVAGPAVNLAIAAVLALGLAFGGTVRPMAEIAVVGGNFVAQLLWINVMLVLFNLLPAFPMDGGRILRAMLALRLDYVRSTRIAAGVGQAMAILFGFAGLLLPNPFLIFIAIFVYLGAQAEAQQAEVKSALTGVRVGDAMMTRFQVVAQHHALSHVVEELLAGAQHDFPVVEDARLMGILLRSDLVRALRSSGPDATVGSVMRRDCAVVEDDAPLERAFRRMRANRCSSVPVVRNDQLVGLLTLENVGELMMVSAALEHGPHARSTLADTFATD